MQGERHNPRHNSATILGLARYHVNGGERDGEDLELLTAFEQVVGYGTGIVLSCIPGKLAYLLVRD